MSERTSEDECELALLGGTINTNAREPMLTRVHASIGVTGRGLNFLPKESAFGGQKHGSCWARHPEDPRGAQPASACRTTVPPRVTNNAAKPAGVLAAEVWVKLVNATSRP